MSAIHFFILLWAIVSTVALAGILWGARKRKPKPTTVLRLGGEPFYRRTDEEIHAINSDTVAGWPEDWLERRRIEKMNPAPIKECWNISWRERPRPHDLEADSIIYVAPKENP